MTQEHVHQYVFGGCNVVHLNPVGAPFVTCETCGVRTPLVDAVNYAIRIERERAPIRPVISKEKIAELKEIVSKTVSSDSLYSELLQALEEHAQMSLVLETLGDYMKGFATIAEKGLVKS
jgi:hypothetical protein